MENEIEQVFGSGDGEHHADDLGRVGPGKVVVEGTKVSLPVDVAYKFVCLHYGRQRFHARHGQGQIGPTMRHHHLDVPIACQHVTADHIRYGTCGLREVLLHGERGLGHHFAVDGFGAMGMQDDDSLPLM